MILRLMRTLPLAPGAAARELPSHVNYVPLNEFGPPFVIAGAIVGGIAGAASKTFGSVADTTSQDGS
jgi:hypothetical protein